MGKLTQGSTLVFSSARHEGQGSLLMSMPGSTQPWAWHWAGTDESSEPPGEWNFVCAFPNKGMTFHS